jgi:hypothetical protein
VESYADFGQCGDLVECSGELKRQFLTRSGK